MRGDEKRNALGGIVCEDPTLRAALDRAVLVAPTTTPVLVTGESGTGKELVARVLHELGPNPGGPLVAVNCGALPRELAESELFGHERGAFTGAAGRRAGWFEEASGGTLVLDENRRAAPRSPAEAPARARVGAAAAGGRLGRGRGTGARRSDDAARSRGGGAAAQLPRRSLLPAGRDLPAAAAAAGTVRGHRAPGHAVPARDGGRGRTAPAGGGRAGRARCRRLAGERARAAQRGPAGRDPGARARRRADHRRSPRVSPPVSFRLSDAGSAAPLLPEDVIRIRGRRFEEIERDVYAWALRDNAGSRRRAARALAVARSTFCDKVRRYCL